MTDSILFTINVGIFAVSFFFSRVVYQGIMIKRLYDGYTMFDVNSVSLNLLVFESGSPLHACYTLFNLLLCIDVWPEPYVVLKGCCNGNENDEEILKDSMRIWNENKKY